MAALTTLPTELTEQIVLYLGQADLYHLLCTSRHFKDHVLHVLYSDVEITSYPGQPDQPKCDAQCLHHLYRLTSLVLGGKHEHLASLVRTFNFEAYIGSNAANQDALKLPRKAVDAKLRRAVQSRIVFPDGPADSEGEFREEFQDPSCVDYMLALLLPFLSNLECLRLVFYKNGWYCKRMLYRVTLHPGRLFPPSAFQKLRAVAGDTGNFLTRGVLWDEFNLFFSIDSVTTVIGHIQRPDPNGFLPELDDSFSVPERMTSEVSTIVFGGVKRNAKQLLHLVDACRAPTTLGLKWGYPEIPVQPGDLLHLLDVATLAHSSLTELVVEYRESVALEDSDASFHSAFSRPLTDFAALTTLKLGLIFIFDLPCLWFPQGLASLTPLDVARAFGPGVEDRLSTILPPQLKHLTIRRHKEERQVPLLLNVENLFQQRARFQALSSVVVENTYHGEKVLSSHELKGPCRSNDAKWELAGRGLNMGISFFIFNNCDKASKANEILLRYMAGDVCLD